MVDAGSTGSRIHVYKFNNCGASPALEDEVFVQTIPGLSAYADQPEEAAKSLDVLMQAAVENVPIHLRRCSPIAVKATAGLRLLGDEKSQSILDAVQHRLKHHYPFPIYRKDGVGIMDGRDEGVYAWITVNHLLGNFEPLEPETTERTTAAIFDLGGGSTQIVFEPDLHGASEPLADGEHKYELDYANDVYTLYQHSYLGYGLMEARKQIKSYPIQEAANEQGEVFHACLPKDVRLPFVAADGANYTLIGLGSGHDECREIVHKILNKNKECIISPCSFDGIYQPSLMETFAHHPIYIFSYFYDRTRPLGLSEVFTVGDLRVLTDDVCSGDYLAQVTDPDLRHEMLDRPEWCMDLSYIYGLLRYGYEIPDDRTVHVAKKIKGVETGWCLGASIAMLEDVSFCEIDP
ncbi:nucleoside phosphatase GDA1/CD39 [Umbelopsis sp. AD052]|nr:nucleoside phosphatase GDA1/CD39 [Umbelopsis sp. AD052]